MDTRKAFLGSAQTLMAGYFQLMNYRIVGTTASIAILDVHVRNPHLYRSNDLPLVKEIKSVGPHEFRHFEVIFHESSMILAFSWLEAFLAEVEEALYLKEPAHLGEQVQIKLGKVLDSSSIEDLLHDLIRRRVRERGQWSLEKRLADLKDQHSFALSQSEEDLKYLSRTRNDIIHNRRAGLYKVNRKRVSYENASQKGQVSLEQTQKFLGIAANTIVDLYEGATKALKITKRYPLHRELTRHTSSWRTFWTERVKLPSQSSLGSKRT